MDPTFKKQEKCWMMLEQKLDRVKFQYFPICQSNGSNMLERVGNV